jgi:hypothetical protein
MTQLWENKSLRYTVIGLGATGILTLLFRRPSEFSYKLSKVIDAPTAEVYAFLKDVKNYYEIGRKGYPSSQNCEDRIEDSVATL